MLEENPPKKSSSLLDLVVATDEVCVGGGLLAVEDLVLADENKDENASFEGLAGPVDASVGPVVFTADGA